MLRYQMNLWRNAVMSILDVIKQSNDMMPESYKELSRKDMERALPPLRKSSAAGSLYQAIIIKRMK